MFLIKENHQKLWSVPAWHGFSKPLESALKVLRMAQKSFTEGHLPRIPDSGSFSSVVGAYSAGDWDFVFFFEAEPSFGDRNLRDLSLGVRRKDSDMIVSEYLLQQIDNAAIARWFETQIVSEETLEEIGRLLTILSDKLE